MTKCPRSSTIPENLVVTLTISADAPAIKLRLFDATIVGLASVGHSNESICRILGKTRNQLDPSVRRLIRKFECKDADALWRLFETEGTRLFDYSTF